MEQNALQEARRVVNACMRDAIHTIHFTDIAAGGLAWSGGQHELEGRYTHLFRGGAIPFPQPTDIQGLKDFATEQHAKGFPFLFRLNVVWLCTLAETTVNDLVKILIKNDPDVRRLKKLRPLQGSLVDFLEMDDDMRAEHLVKALSDSLQVQYGYRRQKALLSAINLPFEAPKPIEKALVEMFNVRNVIVHRRGKADRRLLDACQWTKWQLDADVPLTRDHWVLYSHAVAWYATKLDALVCTRYSQPSQSAIDFCDSMEKDINEYFAARDDVYQTP